MDYTLRQFQYTVLYEANLKDNTTIPSHKYISTCRLVINNLVSAVTSNSSSFIIDGDILYCKKNHILKVPFLDEDDISAYKANDRDNYSFSCTQIKRGLYTRPLIY